jgi:hypothetical protein
VLTELARRLDDVLAEHGVDLHTDCRSADLDAASGNRRVPLLTGPDRGQDR